MRPWWWRWWRRVRRRQRLYGYRSWHLWLQRRWKKFPPRILVGGTRHDGDRRHRSALLFLPRSAAHASPIDAPICIGSSSGACIPGGGGGIGGVGRCVDNPAVNRDSGGRGCVLIAPAAATIASAAMPSQWHRFRGCQSPTSPPGDTSTSGELASPRARTQRAGRMPAGSAAMPQW